MTLDTLIESSTKELGVRFNLVGVVPSVVLFLFVLALLWSGAPSHAPDFGRALERATEVGVKESAFLILGVLVFSLLLQPLQLSLVRILEGYWTVPLVPIIGSVLSTPGIAWQRLRRRKLEAQTRTAKPRASLTQHELATIAAADRRLRRHYPAAQNVLPTSLGNALRASEDVPQKKYKLDAIVVWPRLYPLLPESMLGILADRRNQLDLAVRFCAIFLLATIISVAFLYNYQWWQAIPAATLLLAWVSYRGAINAAVAYGESVQTAFDLYRLELLKALHFPQPENLRAEREMNELISDFLRQGLDRGLESLSYEKPKSDEKARSA